MMIRLIVSGNEKTLVHQLPEPDIDVDPRAIFWTGLKFEVDVNFTAMTVTRIDRGKKRF